MAISDHSPIPVASVAATRKNFPYALSGKSKVVVSGGMATDAHGTSGDARY